MRRTKYFSRTLLAALAAATLLLAGCSSSDDNPSGDDGDTGAVDDSGETDGTSADDTEPDDTEPDDAAPADDGAKVSVGDVDWATVDLGTFDWTTLDTLDGIDEDALTGNPTYDDLDRDALFAAFPDLAEGGGGEGSGSASLTIDGTTHVFDGFVCAFGHDNTESETYSFSSNAFGEIEGARVQFQVNVRDPDGEGRTEGDGVIPDITLDDIDDFENPSVSFFTRADKFSLTIEGDHLTGEGVIYDDVAFVEGVPVSLDATCGDGSRR